ncbi:hypothetical protein SO694_00105068 [Aureococcus anophagefferens]|uniref:YHS domain-containing protein n=1 Tax=Aureococcus anophagefferens TaxID=44056 RepID=A0ABR1FMA8_AURAN
MEQRYDLKAECVSKVWAADMASLAFAPSAVGAPSAPRLPDVDDESAPARERPSARVALTSFVALGLFLYAGANGGALPVTGSSAVYFAETSNGKPLSPTGKPLPKKENGLTKKEAHVAEEKARKQAVQVKEALDLGRAEKTKKVDDKHVITHTEEVKVKHVDTQVHEVKKFDEARTHTENSHAKHKGAQLARGRDPDAPPAFTPATEKMDVNVADVEDAADGPQTEVCTDAAAGPVLDGADVVAYHALEPGANATYGSPEFEASYGDYSFWFASEANRAAFAADPAKYAPKFGGFCSYGISDETFWTKSTLGPFSNPNVWRIVDGRLLVFMYCTPEHKFFSQNITAQLDRGNQIWDTWWGDDLVFNTQCFWTSKMEGGAQDADAEKYACLF